MRYEDAEGAEDRGTNETGSIGAERGDVVMKFERATVAGSAGDEAESLRDQQAWIGVAENYANEIYLVAAEGLGVGASVIA